MAQDTTKKYQSGSPLLGPTNINPAWKGVGSKMNSAMNKVPKIQQNITDPFRGKLQTKTSTSSGVVPTPNQSTSPAPTQTSNTASLQSQINAARQQAQDIQQGINNLKTTQQTTQQTAQTTPMQQKGTSGIFPDIISSLRTASNPTKEQERARKEMERIAAGNKAIADEARRTSEVYGKEIARVGQLGAGAVAGNLSTGTNVVGSGNAAIASQSASQRMNALAQGLTSELKGTEQQLTGQEQMAQAFRPSLEATLTQQQQQISGLGAAGGLAAPTQVQPGSSLVTPYSGELVHGGLGGWADYTTAQQVQSLIEQYPDAGIQYNPQLTPQQNLQQIQQALGGSNMYSKSVFGVPGQNTIQGAANVQLGQQGYQQFGLQTEGLRQAILTAESFGQNLASVMDKYSINGMPLRAVNVPINALKKQYSAEMAAFQAALQETANAYNQVFTSSGTTPTNAGEISNAIFNENSTPQQMVAALMQLEQQAKTKLMEAERATTGFYGLLGNGGGVFAEQW